MSCRCCLPLPCLLLPLDKTIWFEHQHQRQHEHQSGTLLIEGSTLEDSGSLSDSFNGGAAARASDFWRGLGREGDGGLKAPAGADGDRWTGDMGNANVNDDDDDSDGGGGFGFGGDFGGPEDDDDLDEQEPKDDLDVRNDNNLTGCGMRSSAGVLCVVCSVLLSVDRLVVIIIMIIIIRQVTK